eukprot:1196369-Prorocentrum_minimum.AAC.4
MRPGCEWACEACEALRQETPGNSRRENPYRRKTWQRFAIPSRSLSHASDLVLFSGLFLCFVFPHTTPTIRLSQGAKMQLLEKTRIQAVECKWSCEH